MDRNQALAAAASLNPKIKVSQPAKMNMSGSQTNIGKFTSVIPKMPSITYTLDNTGAGATTTYIIGDVTGMIAAKNGGSPSAPDKVNGLAALVTPNKNFLNNARVSFSRISIETSSDATQFSQAFEHRVTNMAGNVNSTPLPVAEAKSNVQQNPLLLTVTGQFDLDISSAYVVDVIDNEIVTLICTVGLYVV